MPPRSKRKWQARWAEDKLYTTPDYVRKTQLVLADDVSISLRDSPCRPLVRRLSRPTHLPASSAGKVSTSCFRWDSTHLACRPKTRPSGTTSTPPYRPARTSSTCASSTRDGRHASTGTAKSAPATRDFYHWNQWIFLRMLERGLAYRKAGSRLVVPGRSDGAGQ